MSSDISLSKKFQKDGYVHLKGIFSEQEIHDIRCEIASLGASSPEADVLTYPNLRWVLLDERVLKIFREILGATLVYFGDSTIRNESSVGGRAFHRDSQEDFEDPSNTEYPIARMGLYLQNHLKFSGGLKVRVGSHRHEFFGRKNIKRVFFGGPAGPLSFDALRLGRPINLDIEAGDLVIWNLRLWHSGYAARLKFAPKVCINPKLEKYIPYSWMMPMQYPRMAIFSTLGAPSKNLDKYILNRSGDDSNRCKSEISRYNSAEVIELAENSGVILNFDMINKLNKPDSESPRVC